MNIQLVLIMAVIFNGGVCFANQNNSLCEAIGLRDRIKVNRLLKMGADLNESCGRLEYDGQNCSSWYPNYPGLDPLAFTVLRIGQGSLNCSIHVSFNSPDDDKVMLGILKDLLKKRPNLAQTYRISPYELDTVSSLAIESRAYKALGLLLEAGVDVNDTLFYLMAKRYYDVPTKIISRVLKAGGNPNLTFHDEPISFLAVTGTRADIMKIFVNNSKIDWCVPTKNGYGQYGRIIDFVLPQYLSYVTSHRGGCP